MRLILLLFIPALFSGCATDKAWDSSLDLDTPGRCQIGQCAPYADALATKLQAEGYSGRVVAFSYRNEDGTEGAHRLVIYEDPQYTPHSFLMSNELIKPVWLPDWPLEEQIKLAYQNIRELHIYKNDPFSPNSRSN